MSEWGKESYFLKTFLVWSVWSVIDLTFVWDMRSIWQDRKNSSVNEYLWINILDITCPVQLSIYSLHHLLISSLCHPSEFPEIFYFDAENSIWKVTLVLSSHSFTSLCSKLLAMLWHNLDLILCVLKLVLKLDKAYLESFPADIYRKVFLDFLELIWCVDLIC